MESEWLGQKFSKSKVKFCHDRRMSQKTCGQFSSRSSVLMVLDGLIFSRGFELDFLFFSL